MIVLTVTTPTPQDSQAVEWWKCQLLPWHSIARGGKLCHYSWHLTPAFWPAYLCDFHRCHAKAEALSI